jgi:hypothetical protein
VPRLAESPPPPDQSTPLTFCTFHFERAGKRRKAIAVVLSEAFCRRCYAGGHISKEELQGETGDVEVARASAEYFQRHKAEILERRRARRRLLDAEYFEQNKDAGQRASRPGGR